MALYVAICLLAALLAVSERGAHAHAIGIIWGVTVGLAVAQWYAFRVSARMVGTGRNVREMSSLPVLSWRGP